MNQDERTAGINELAELLAFNHVHKLRNEAGDTDQDWRLIASEHGCSEEDYIETQVAIRGTEFLTELKKLPEALQDAMIDVFLVTPEKQYDEMEHTGTSDAQPPVSNVIPFRRRNT